MFKLLLIITGRIYDDLIDYHIEFIKKNYNILNYYFNPIFIRLDLWEISDDKIRNKLNSLNNFIYNINITYYDSKLFSNIGFLKTFELNNFITNKINLKDYEYIMRLRTDILIKRILFDFDKRIYYSFKWARGVTDNFGFCISDNFKKIWGELDKKELILKGPEIYLRDKLKKNNIKIRELNIKLVLIKSLKEKRRPGTRIWDKTNKLIYIYKSIIDNEIIFN
jgi:hypothetical protein